MVSFVDKIVNLLCLDNSVTKKRCNLMILDNFDARMLSFAFLLSLLTGKLVQNLSKFSRLRQYLVYFVITTRSHQCGQKKCSCCEVKTSFTALFQLSTLFFNWKISVILLSGVIHFDKSTIIQHH